MMNRTNEKTRLLSFMFIVRSCLDERMFVLPSCESYLPFFQILPEISVSDGTGRGVWGEREGFPQRGVEGGTCPPFKKTLFKGSSNGVL